MALAGRLTSGLTAKTAPDGPTAGDAADLPDGGVSNTTPEFSRASTGLRTRRFFRRKAGVTPEACRSQGAGRFSWWLALALLAVVLAGAVLSNPPSALAQERTVSGLPDYSTEGRQPLEYLFSQVPGGSPVLVGLSLLTVVGGVMVLGRGAAWCGPASAIGVVGVVGVLNAMELVGSVVAAVVIILALLAGLAFFRTARTA